MPTPVSLALRTPFDAAGLAGFLAARAVPGVESVDDRTYRRGALALTLHDDHVVLDTSRRRPSDTEVAGARRLLDLDADPEPIGAALAADPALAALVAAAPGLRVPGAWDGFEVAVRAVVGQQVTVAAARTLLGRLVTRCEVAGRFPTPAELLAADLDAMGMPGSRVATLRAVAAATLAGDVVLDGDAPAADVVAALRGCEASGRGRRATSRCERCATRMPSRSATPVCAPQRGGSAYRSTMPPCSNGPSGGGRGGRTPPCTCGAPSQITPRPSHRRIELDRIALGQHVDGRRRREHDGTAVAGPRHGRVVPGGRPADGAVADDDRW